MKHNRDPFHSVRRRALSELVIRDVRGRNRSLYSAYSHQFSGIRGEDVLDCADHDNVNNIQMWWLPSCSSSLRGAS